MLMMWQKTNTRLHNTWFIIIPDLMKCQYLHCRWKWDPYHESPFFNSESLSKFKTGWIFFFQNPENHSFFIQFYLHLVAMTVGDRRRRDKTVSVDCDETICRLLIRQYYACLEFSLAAGGVPLKCRTYLYDSALDSSRLNPDTDRAKNTKWNYFQNYKGILNEKLKSEQNAV